MLTRQLDPLCLVVVLGLLLVARSASATDLASYAKWCSHCHGERGDGRGPAAAALSFNGRPPRDFRAGVFRFKSTEPGSPPSDADLARTISEGLPGTSMPYFKDLLSADEIRRLAESVRSFSGLAAGSREVDLGQEIADGGATRARGSTLFRELGCPSCHGPDGRGKATDAPSLRNVDGSTANPTDLTRPWRFRGGATARDIALRLATGLDGTPMPSYSNTATAADLWRVAHFVRSLAVAPSLREAASADARRALPAASVERGEYVAKSGTCFLCHVQMKPDGSYAEQSFGAGGMKVEIHYVGTMYSRNLTPDPETGLGEWTADEFRDVFRRGRSKNGRVLNPLDMPWTVLAGLAEPDVDSLFQYLRSLPPVQNAVPMPEAPGLFEGLIAKSTALALGDHERAYFGFHPGNFGRSDEGAPPPTHNPRAPLWLALACAAALVLAARRGLRGPRFWLTTVCLVAVPALYAWPPVTLLPTGLLLAKPPFDAIAPWLGLPPIRPAPPPLPTGDADLDRLAERGRYVATIGTCSLCHTAGPSWIRLWRPFPDLGGGMKVNWRVFGTTYSRNLTPDHETGLGAWSAAEIRRAITSGIARDGRILHWQAMPWDHFSNLTLEDLEALVVYLERLKPAYSKIPPPAPPAPTDLPGDSFWLGYSGDYRPDFSEGLQGRREAAGLETRRPSEERSREAASTARGQRVSMK